VGVVEADREEVRFVGLLLNVLGGGGRACEVASGVAVIDREITDCVRVGREDAVVAQHTARIVVFDLVLLADEHRFEPTVGKESREVAIVIVHREATMCEADETVRVGGLPGEHRPAGGRTGRPRAVRAPEGDPRFCERTEPRGVDGVTVRPDVSTGIVGVDDDDVRHATTVQDRHLNPTAKRDRGVRRRLKGEAR
jgi:hypothetical protein